jgi:phage host-nuclease inhibitor protein Gam
VHRAQLKALTDLLAEKAKLEASMEAKLADLRESYDMHSRDLEAALATKIKDLE